MYIPFRVCFYTFLAVFALSGVNNLAHAEDETGPAVITIGVLAHRGDAFAKKQWRDTLSYLQLTIPKHTFRLEPFDLPGLEQAVQAHTVDFILTNPGHTVYLGRYHGTSQFATVQAPGSRDPSRSLGSTIFTRAERKDLKTLSDLQGARLLTVSRQAFGGFLIGWGAIVDVMQTRASSITIDERGFPQDAIVAAVMAGEGDIGIVRSCLLEHLAANGKLDLANVKVLSQRHEPRFHCAVSSDLYPGWAFSKHPKTSVTLATAVARALYAMPAPENATELDYEGWIAPISYASVEALYRKLRITPFVPGTWTVLRTIMRENIEWFVFTALVAALFLGHVARVEWLVLRRTRQLETEEAHRREAMVRIRELEAETARAYRANTMAEMAGGLAHELNQPIAAILNYAHALSELVKQEKVDPRLTERTLEKIRSQGERAAAVVRGIFDFLRNRPPHMTEVDLRGLVDQALEFIELNAVKYGCQLNWCRPATPVIASVDEIQFQQVLMIVVQNAMEACADLPEARKRINISLSYDGSRCILEVTDCGKGLDEEEKGRAFEPFYTSKSGLGLGLSVANTIVQRHHGSLVLSSIKGEGTTVTVRLPTFKGVAHE